MWVDALTPQRLLLSRGHVTQNKKPFVSTMAGVAKKRKRSFPEVLTALRYVVVRLAFPVAYWC